MFQQEILNQIQVNIHSSVCIRGEKVIYIDPIRIPDEPHDADLILISIILPRRTSKSCSGRIR